MTKKIVFFLLIILVFVKSPQVFSQRENDDALIFVGEVVKGFIDGDTWIEGPPLYFYAGPLTFMNITPPGISLRKMLVAKVFGYRKQVVGDLRIPRHVSVGELDRFEIISLNEGALRGCDMKSVNLPGEVRTIPADCFASCEYLEEVQFHGETHFIESGAFRWTPSLKTLHLPSGLKYIGDFAFDASGISSFEMPKSVEYLGQAAFRYCRNLTEIKFHGHRLGELNGYVFEGCEALKKVELPIGMHSIMSYAFNKAGLEFLVLPSSIKKIYNYAFNETNLKRIDCHATNPPQIGEVFTTANYDNIELHVPNGSQQKYQTAPGWANFVHIIPDL